MIWPVLIWSAAVPATVALVVLALSIKLAPRRASAAGEHGRAHWGAALAVGAAYISAQLGLDGGPTAGEITDKILFWVAVGALLIGVVESVWQRMPQTLRWALRLLSAAVVGYAVASPLAAAQQWSSAALVGWVVAIGGALLLIWTVLDSVAARERGPSLSMSLCIVGAIGAGALVVSNLATSARVAGAIAAACGSMLIVTWRAPAEGRLRSAAPLLAAALVTHWAIAALYGEMPKATFALLVGAPAALLLARVPSIERASAAVGVALRFAVIGAAMALAFGLAAHEYFADGGDAGGYGAAASHRARASNGSGGGGSGSAAGPQRPSNSGGGGSAPADDDYGYD